MNFRHNALQNPFLDHVSGVDATLKSFVSNIHNKYHHYGLIFDYSLEPSESFQRKTQFVKKRILEHFFENDLKIFETKSSAKIFSLVCKTELKRNNPYNGVHICNFLSKQLNSSERIIIFQTLCGIFLSNRHVCPVLKFCHGQKCRLCNKEASLQHFLFDCAEMKNQRKELFETVRSLLKKPNPAIPLLSDCFAREDKVRGRDDREQRDNSVKILKATAKFMIELRCKVTGQEAPTE